MSTKTAANVAVTDQPPHLATSEILFNRILVATDFSWPANQALKMAILLCQLFGAKLTLVHASVPVVSGIETIPVPAEVLTTDLDADKEQMNQLVLSEPGLSALTPKVVVAYAEAIDLITRVSKDEKADLIVVGSHGASGLERLVLGSVAEAVMHQATCPVLIVGPNCKPEQHPSRSVLFATDLKTTGLRGAQYAAGLAERFHAKLTFLHVMGQDFERHRERELVKDRMRQELALLLPPDVEQYCKTKILLEYGKPDETITAVAKRERTSMIVVGLRDRALADHAVWSTLSYIIREANCPVLGVRGHLV
jgi:nucleotide-binding universal stress UspA family protein